MSVIITEIDMQSCGKERCECLLDIYETDSYNWCAVTKQDTDDKYVRPNCPMKSIEGLIEKIKNESYLSYDDNPRHILDEDAVIHIIKEYCEVENANSD